MIRPFFSAALVSLILIPAVHAKEEATAPTPAKTPASLQKENTVQSLCEEIGKKLGSVSIKDCLSQELIDSNKRSNQGRVLAYKKYPPLPTRKPLGRVLLMGGIHGDEYSTYSILFKWMNTLNKYHSGLFHWTVVPALNPDGLLRKKSKRKSGRGVDVNRSFPEKGGEG
jgi:protein MpaA